MNLGAGLSGLSATYPGYMSAEEQASKTELNQQTAKEGALKLLGAHVLGLALAGGAPDEGPQAPPPGQASVPSGPAPGGQQFAGPPGPAAPQAPGGPRMPVAPQPPPAPQQPLSQGAGGVPEGAGPPEISLPALTQRILQTSPGIRNHPEVLLAALERAAPMLDRQGKEDLAEARNKFTEQRLEMAKDALREAVRNHDMQQQERVRAGDQRDTREARLAANSAVRNDATAQRLELQRQDLQRKIENGDRGAALTAWRQTIDALHKRATEVIQSSNQFNTMPEDEKKALLKEQNEAYQTQISQMRALAGSTTPRGGVAPPGAAPEPKIQGQVSPPSNGSTLVTPTTAPAAPGAIPPQVLQDAQSAIAKGAPRAAVIKRLQEQGYPTDGL